MAFSKGTSGNPGGPRKSIGLSRAVRKSEGLNSFAMLLDIRDEKIVVPSVKERREACKLILARANRIRRWTSLKTSN